MAALSTPRFFLPCKEVGAGCAESVPSHWPAVAVIDNSVGPAPPPLY
jgi:hypothetical protein